MVISIHQPSYLPWLPFVEKVLNSDIFVFLDNVQFEKNSEQNRNRIKTASGSTWLTVPVKRNLNTLISEVNIPYEQSNWLKKHISTIKQNYSKAPYYDIVTPRLFDILNRNKTDFISLNIEIDKYFFSLAKFEGEIVYASDLGIDNKKSDRILSICNTLGAETYLSGVAGLGYLNLRDFKKACINVEFQEFSHDEYVQQHDNIGFIPRLSALDFFCNYGIHDSAREKILMSSRWVKYNSN